MKKLILVLALCMASSVQAQSDTGWKVDGTSAVGRAANVVRLEGAEGVQIITDVTAGAGRGVTVGKYGDVQQPVAILTPIAGFTPAAGSYVQSGISAVATASPTLAVVFIEPSKMFADSKGGTRVIISDSASPVLIHPLANAATTPTSINAAAVGTPYSAAAGAVTECFGLTAANARCRAR